MDKWLTGVIGLLLFILPHETIIAQQNSKLTLFSEDEEPFYVYINTIKRNDNPYSKVELTGFDEGTYRIRVNFKKDNILPVERSLHLKEGHHSTYKLVKRREAKEKKGKGKGSNKGHKAKYTLKMVSVNPIGNEGEGSSSGNESSGDNNSGNTSSGNNTQTGLEEDNNQSGSSSGQGQESYDHDHTSNCDHPSHKHSGHQQRKSISIEIEVGQTGQGHEHPTHEHPESGSSEQQEESTETEENTSESESTEESSKEYLPGYNGAVGCTPPMSASEFRDAKSSISDKSFEKTKLKIAKQVTKSHCLLSSQVKEVMQLFTFENTRLEYAKFAYDYTYDLDNYYKVNDAFEYESSIDELNDYID